MERAGGAAGEWSFSFSLEDHLQKGQKQSGPKLGASGAELLLPCALAESGQVAAVGYAGEKMLRWWWLPKSPAPFDLMMCPSADGDSISE